MTTKTNNLYPEGSYIVELLTDAEDYANKVQFISQIEQNNMTTVVEMLWNKNNIDHDDLNPFLVGLKMGVAHTNENMELLDEIEFLIENRGIQK